jgi:hypothetical protein
MGLISLLEKGEIFSTQFENIQVAIFESFCLFFGFLKTIPQVTQRGQHKPEANNEAKEL